MATPNTHPSKALTAFSQVLKSLFRRDKLHPAESDKVDPVAEVREGLKDIKAGRVREIKRAGDLLQDE